LSHDAIVIGAGAAGLFCASIAGQTGLKVLLLDHAKKTAEKIRISGGGRCNFTNIATGPEHFVSRNPAFCRSPLARYTPRDFIDLVGRHRIAFHEKHRGQLFCDGASEQIIRMLLAETAAGGVEHRQPCAVQAVRHTSRGFEVDTDQGPFAAPALVIATGGLSIPQIGASDFGYRIARQFGHAVIEPRPALVPLVFDAAQWAPFAGLAGVSLPVTIRSASRMRFDEDLLFTHRGLSGPAVLQISTYWQPHTVIAIDLAAGTALDRTLIEAKQASHRQLGTLLAERLPARLAQTWLAHQGLDATRPLPECRDRDLIALATSLRQWVLTPTGTEGWKKAEVTAGGVDTAELDARGMESRRIPGLHFIGEVVDVTGWLGGYNFQWAWASAAACARALAARPGRLLRVSEPR
jgi:predicted Rossmann fold flavoprotein